MRCPWSKKKGDDVSSTRDDADNLEVGWKIAPADYRNLIRVLGQRLIVSSLDLCVNNESLFIGEELDASGGAVLQRVNGSSQRVNVLSV